MAVLAFVLALIQKLPYGQDHTNPVVSEEPSWDSPRTRELAARACFDCHSNQTSWPWYSEVAPASWLVQRDVDAGRRRLNFSDWREYAKGGAELARIVREGVGPPWFYRLLQPGARLTPAERDELARGLLATAGP